MRAILLFACCAFAVFAKVEVATSIQPVAFLIENIGGEKVSVVSLVTKGASAHTYEPKPAQMRALAKAKIYFAIGIEFEDIWVPRFKSSNRDLIVVRTDKSVDKLPSIRHDHDHHHAHIDTHIWLSVKNMVIIARAIAKELAQIDSKNSQFYMQNLNNLESDLMSLDRSVAQKLQRYKDRSFLVFHPAWQYFANDYGLKQVAIEVAGKEPKPKELQSTIVFAKESNIKAIFAHSNQSSKSANAIAKEIGAKVIAIDPLEYNYIEMIKTLADELEGAFVD